MLFERASSLVRLLERLPGVGEKTAQRYLLYFLTSGAEYSVDLATALRELRDHVKLCERCGNLAEVSSPEEAAICAICRDDRRDASVLCVVAKVQDLMAIERCGTMKGRYFVLGKLLSPLEGISADDLPIDALKERVVRGNVKELILATPPSVDGEATALWIRREFGDAGVTFSRIASGVPHGGDLEYVDPITVGRALSNRQAF